MLGFDALGRLTLGQPPAGLTFQIICQSGGFSLVGNVANFKTALPCDVGVYTTMFFGVSSKIVARFAYGTMAIAGQPISVGTAVMCFPGSYSTGWSGLEALSALAVGVTGLNVNFDTTMPGATGNYALTLYPIGGKLSGTLDPATITAATYSVTTQMTMNDIQTGEQPAQFGNAALGTLALGQGSRKLNASNFKISGGGASYRLGARLLQIPYTLDFEDLSDELWRDIPVPSTIWTAIDSNRQAS